MVRKEAGVAGVPGSAGEFMWAGALGTFFWVDPKEELAAIYMSQAGGPTRASYRRLIKQLPVNADVPEIDVTFVEEEDPHVGPAGSKGIGELGITGVAAAVANAVWHATGKRVRDLPVTPEKLL